MMMSTAISTVYHTENATEFLFPIYKLYSTDHLFFPVVQ